ncbi:MAG: hypothetical protein PHP86_10350 [Nevskiales bacterium]|nr:hypothetical protein [Nevskiales bacterium]
MRDVVEVQGWSYRPAVTRVTSLLSFGFAAALLYWGWSHRDRYYINAEDGLGYMLGIVGGSLMLLLGLYPLRKHLRWMRNWGAVRHWFRMHMVFGIAGPVAILLHCNFRTGATNSNIALWSMLVVASSGLIGRYLYSRIHEGLYGRHLELGELRGAWLQARGKLDLHAHHLDAIGAAVETFEKPLAARDAGIGASLFGLPVSSWRRHRIARRGRRILRGLADVPHADRDATLALLGQRLAAAGAVYRYHAFDQLFSLWHLLHLPLYFMLIVTGVVHVLAVHMY